MYYLFIPVILSWVLLMLFFLISWQKLNFSNEKMSPFECGFDPMSIMRKPFSMRFFMLMIFFLIFDIELVLLFPIYTLMSLSETLLLLLSFSLFLGMLLLGLFYEWKAGALDWMV
uniref:NADH dehydrogenase subunit 3 n=1 Tax=Virpazaria ripkeni TaxID=2939667 RepID=UPI0020277215|nr:NADH dehydrogenase subunit 3 [Virpazaria ripkeni]UPV69729.1 NADH dehydrogenase subunit 3 [Virpazaria ripkeni]UPV69742.1 NADH dehydrogenase subunit 3 [Virpazaria ripkeni]